MGPSNTGWGRRRYARAIDEEPAAARIRVRDSVRTVGPTPRLGARSEPLRGAAFPAEKSSPRHGESWYPFEMTPKLTDEMRTALSRQADRPVTVEDDQTHLQYVLLPLEIYERLRAIFDDSTFEIAETYSAQSRVAGAAGWDDPEMDVYDQYDLHRNPA
jgi:hypothetical protein